MNKFLESESSKISRKDFLAIMVGMIGAVVFGKMVDLKKAAVNFRSLTRSKDSYGNSPYGGKTS